MNNFTEHIHKNYRGELLHYVVDKFNNQYTVINNDINRILIDFIKQIIEKYNIKEYKYISELKFIKILEYANDLFKYIIKEKIIVAHGLKQSGGTPNISARFRLTGQAESYRKIKRI